MKKPIYLDYNATTPIEPRVAKAMEPYLYGMFGNPSSAHPYGVEARKAIELARRQVADMLGCSSDEIVFTAGGTEANNMAIKGAAEHLRAHGNHIIISAVEHPAVTEPCRFLEQRGFQITVIPVDTTGWVEPAAVEKAMRPGTILVSVMHANNEVGTVQSVAEIAAIAHHHGAVMHTDAAQSIGKIEVNVDRLNVDLLSIAGHKLYAPKGIGALYIRGGVELDKFMHGADHEYNRRAGTENVLEIVGLGEAARLAREELGLVSQHMLQIRERFLQNLREGLGESVDWRVNGHPDQHIPNTLSISFRGVEANTLLAEIQDRIAASAGAACHAEAIELSPVLEAMQLPVEYAMGTVRLSVGRMTTEDEVDQAAKIISLSVRRLQPGPPSDVYKDTDEKIRLTRYTHGMGCACKLRPQALEAVLSRLPIPVDPDVLVDITTSDDAAVYRLRDDLAVVVTVDFFTPIADDPFMFGSISAANSLSDIYAMGAQPLFALNIVAFPTNRLPIEVLEAILAGAAEKASEAGVSILGGHTVDDTEPKYGMAVVGIVHPDRVVRNSTANAGDQLFLTKPIGTGILSTAIKQDMANEDIAAHALQTMARLNRRAAETMQAFPVSACTDVTGFGLLGHLREMTKGSGMDALIHFDAIPLLMGTEHMAAAGMIPGGTRDNLDYVRPFMDWGNGLSEVQRLILADAQTSGGLLIAVPAESAQTFLEGLHANGTPEAAQIGAFTGSGEGRIRVEK
ncbi:MAG: selenide, water dikinase SelD [Anaerolineales bacterium]|nr:selenide, water dikinase SelD [Anaerolineales bacterium]